MPKIEDLNELTVQAGGDIIAIVDDVGGSPETKKITITNLFQGIPVDISITKETPALTIDASDTTTSPALLNLKADRAGATSIVARMKFFNNGVTAVAEVRALRGSADTAGDLQLITANAVVVHVDENGKVGIGTTVPDGTLHVHTASAGAVVANATYNDLVVENSTNVGLSLLAPDDKLAGNVFGYPGNDNYHGIIGGGPTHATLAGILTIRVAGGDRIKIASTHILSEIPLKILEAADDVADSATYGQLWVLNGDPNTLMYTDGDGTKFTVDVSAV